jgi:predicted ArsR family transcriptional regulator
MEALIAARVAGDTAETPAMVAVALGFSPVRLELLRALVVRGQATVAQLARATGCTRNGLRPHLTALEDLGAFRSDIERVPGSFRPTRVYRIDDVRLEEIAWNLYDAVVAQPAMEVTA